MNGLELYRKLAQLRDEDRTSADTFCMSLKEEDIFVQLLSLAFTNENQPDELPEVFNISNVVLTKEDVETLMDRIGLNVTVEFVSKSTGYGYTFIIAQK